MDQIQGIHTLHINETIPLTQLNSSEVRLSQALHWSASRSTSVNLGISAAYNVVDVIVSFAPFPNLWLTVIRNSSNSENTSSFSYIESISQTRMPSSLAILRWRNCKFLHSQSCPVYLRLESVPWFGYRLPKVNKDLSISQFLPSTFPKSRLFSTSI